MKTKIMLIIIICFLYSSCAHQPYIVSVLTNFSAAKPTVNNDDLSLSVTLPVLHADSQPVVAVGGSFIQRFNTNTASAGLTVLSGYLCDNYVLYGVTYDLIQGRFYYSIALPFSRWFK